MELKINLPLIGRIEATFGKSVAPSGQKKSAETTESGMLGNVFDWYYQNVKLERTRIARYSDYEIMDEEYPEISAALDMYADNATQAKEVSGDSFKIIAKDTRVQKILDELAKRCGLQDSNWDTARGISKFGDEFDELIVDGNDLIVKVKPLPVNTIYYETDEYGRPIEKPYVQKDVSTQQKIVDFFPWQICHWKNGGLKKKYGDSIMRSIRRVYKQLQMMEDGMVVGRLTRSHLRFKILVDIEGMEKDAAEDTIKKVKTDMRKKRLMNPSTGQLETTQNPLSAEEDFFLGVTKDSKANVEALQGAMNLGNIRDVEYFQTKLFTGLKTPKGFMGLEKDINAKGTMVEQSIQFARSVGRIRKGLRIGLTTICDRQLILDGIPPSTQEYAIVFHPISMIDELRKWTIEKIKAEIAKIYRVEVGMLSDDFIYTTFLGLSEDEIAKLKTQTVTPPPPKLAIGARASTPALRIGGMQGVGGAQSAVAKQTAQITAGMEGNHVLSMRLLSLLEDLNDLVDAELDR